MPVVRSSARAEASEKAAEEVENTLQKQIEALMTDLSSQKHVEFERLQAARTVALQRADAAEEGGQTWEEISRRPSC